MRMAVPPNLVGFTEAAGLEAVAYGLDSKPIMDLQRKYWTCYFRTPWKLKELNRMGRETAEFATQCWGEMTTALASAAAGADLLLTGLIFEQPAANVAEYHDIPLATLHFFPVRAHGRLLPFLPSPLSRAVMTVNDWLAWRGTKKGEDAQRRELGLPKATAPRRGGSLTADRWKSRLTTRCTFPDWLPNGRNGMASDRLSARWRWRCRRTADDEVASWIAAGTPPICFGFGSVPVESPADTLAMISAACAQLGERALVCSGWTDFGRVPRCRARQSGGRGELRDHLSGLPGGRAPRRRGHPRGGPAGRSPPADPLDVARSAVLCGSAQTTEGGRRPALFDHYPEVVGRGPAPDSCPAIRRPRPRDRPPDHRTGQKRCGRRRPGGKVRPPRSCWLTCADADIRRNGRNI